MRHIATVPTKNIVHIVLGVLALLLIPLTLTLLNQNASIYGGAGGGWDWMPGDFVVMGTLLFLTGFAISIAVRNISTPLYRIAAVLSILAALFLIWIELAVDAVSRFLAFLSSLL